MYMYHSIKLNAKTVYKELIKEKLIQPSMTTKWSNLNLEWNDWQNIFNVPEKQKFNLYSLKYYTKYILVDSASVFKIGITTDPLCLRYTKTGA
jgi:hypothetical protein